MQPQPVRTNIYIDGLNLYYGAIRGTRFKWLNLESLFVRLRQHDSVVNIYYFTALIEGTHRANQEQYLRALATLPKVKVVLGRFKTKQATCRVMGCRYAGSRDFDIREEKRTDVSIAIHLLDDAYQKTAERFVLVSGDSDLVPAVLMTKKRFPRVEIIVYVPARHPIRGAATELRGAADKNRTLPMELVKRSQFPSKLTDSEGNVIAKPAS